MQPAHPPTGTETEWVPEQKVSIGAAAIGIPLGVVVAYIMEQFGLEVPPTVASAIGSLVSALAAYFVPNPR